MKILLNHLKDKTKIKFLNKEKSNYQFYINVMNLYKELTEEKKIKELDPKNHKDVLSFFMN